MNSLLFLIPLSALFIVGAGVALFWAIDHGQFDGMDAPALLPVLDSDIDPADAAPKSDPDADVEQAR